MRKIKILVFLLLVVIPLWGAYASSGELSGTWYSSDGKELDIWWCDASGSLRFEISQPGTYSIIASGRIEEVVGVSGTSYVFITDDSRTFQASYDGQCMLSISGLGTFQREECEQGTGPGTGGFNPCATAGDSWDNVQQPGMYVYFYENFGQCGYELYIQGQLVDTGTVEVQGNSLIFHSSQSGKVTQGEVLDSCSFRWGEAGVFRYSQCGEEGGGGGGGYPSPPMGDCQEFNYPISSPYGGTMIFSGEMCQSQNAFFGTMSYSNFVEYSYLGPIYINGSVNISVGGVPPENPQVFYWDLNGGPLYYNIQGYGTFTITFNQVEFITDSYLQPVGASGEMIVNGVSYPVTPDMFSLIFGF